MDGWCLLVCIYDDDHNTGVHLFLSEHYCGAASDTHYFLQPPTQALTSGLWRWWWRWWWWPIRYWTAAICRNQNISFMEIFLMEISAAISRNASVAGISASPVVQLSPLPWNTHQSSSSHLTNKIKKIIIIVDIFYPPQVPWAVTFESKSGWL